MLRVTLNTFDFYSLTLQFICNFLNNLSCIDRMKRSGKITFNNKTFFLHNRYKKLRLKLNVF